MLAAPERRHADLAGVEPPRSAADRRRPPGRQHGRLRLPQHGGRRDGFVTFIANYIPFEAPSGGPHFYKFDDTVLYEIKIDNTGDGVEDVSYQFQFTNNVKNGDIILGMASPNEALAGKGGIDPLITDGNDPDFNETQYFSVTRVDRHTGPKGKVLATGLHTPPCNIGSRTTPDYEKLAQHTIHQLPGGGRVFAGQRDEG